MKTHLGRYTLIELIAVLAIVLLVAGVVAANAGRIPAFISLENSAQKLQYLFSRAQMMAVAQGRSMTVNYDSDRKAFSIAQASDSSDGPAAGVSSSKTSMERIPESMDIEFEGDNPAYVFFPDGTGSGTAFKLTLKGYSCRIRISALTGLAILEKTEGAR